MSKQFEGCVFYFFNDLVKKKKKTIPMHKLTTKSFYIMNELTNTMKIKNFRTHFNICENSSELTIMELEEEMQNLSLSQEIKKDNTILLNFDDRDLISFKNYFKALSSSKIYILTIINSYKHILKSIEILISNNIVHNHINFVSVLVDKDNNSLLSDFSLSIDVSKPDIEQYIKHFIIGYDASYLEWPLEFHIVSYLLTNKLNSLSSYNIYNIICEYIDNHTILKTFGETVVSLYKEEAVNYFKKYVNQSYEYILNDMLQYYNTWDNYALSILFLRILIGIHKTIKVNNKFIILFMKLLVSNVHLNPSKRVSVGETTNKFESILNMIEPKDYYQIFNNLII
jgi:hypothetical protein